MLAIVNLVLTVWNMVLRGLVIKTFWAWFILPLFPGLPVLHIVPAIGLSYFVGVLSPIKYFTEEEWDKIFNRDSDSSRSTLVGFLNGITLSVGLGAMTFFGWIVHCFMG